MSVRRRLSRLGVATLGAVLLGGAFSGGLAAQEIDPFYTSMLRDGTQALVRGEPERAVEDLRIACFGLLEQPALLAECQVRVALAQAALAERDEFVATFRKLEEIEERFQGYSNAKLTAEERRAFETHALEWVSPQVLRANPRFAALVERKQAEELEALPAAKRLRELERRAAAEPAEPRWRLRLAELELERERPAQALERLEGLAPAAGDGAVACLRGRAHAELERCEPAVAAFASCPRRGQEAALLEAELACLIDLARRDDGRALLAAAPPALAARPAVKKLAAELAAEPDGAPVAGKAPAARRDSATRQEPPAKSEPATRKPTAAKPAVPPPAATPVPKRSPAAAASTPQPAPPPAASEPLALDAETARRAQEARATMRSAQSAADLERALSQAQPLAEAQPERSELQYLVGEIAYRASRWRECAAAYRRAGTAGPADPTQRFYMAVCLFESGDRAAAATLASSGLEELPRTPFAESYLRRILARP